MDTPNFTTLKHCSKCNQDLPATVEYFPARADSKDGLRGCCRECTHERRVQYYSKHREEAIAYSRTWEQGHREQARESKLRWARENRDLINQRHKEQRKEHPEQYREYSRKWSAANPEKVTEKRRRWESANREKVRENVRRSYRKHREARLQQDKVYRGANPDKIKEQWRSWYTANAEHVRERARIRGKSPEGQESRRSYRQANAEKINEKNRLFYRTPEGKAARAAYAHKRRARKLAGGGSFTPADLIAIRAAQTDRKGRLICWKCGKPIKGTPHLDHWIPLDKEGSNGPGNLHYMHARCNLEKGAKLPTEIGRLL